MTDFRPSPTTLARNATSMSCRADREDVSKVGGGSRAVAGKKIGAHRLYLLSPLARRVKEAGRE
jgi:hypothetical protein